jgi:hypothetical protein
MDAQHRTLPSGSIVFPPLAASSPTTEAPTLLVHFCGASCPTEAYVAYAKATQAAANAHGVSLCVCILQYPPGWIPFVYRSGIALQPGQLHHALKTAVREIYNFQEGETSGSDTAERSAVNPFESMILSGHSLGSQHMQALSVWMDKLQHRKVVIPDLVGMIALGGYVNIISQDEMPGVPIATINGNRDGLIKLSRYSSVYNWVVEKVPDASVRARRAPLAVLEVCSYVCMHMIPFRHAHKHACINDAVLVCAPCMQLA